MKKSNKLFLGGFLTVMLMITGIHVALFAKYKNGKYTIYHPQDKREQYMRSFPNVLFVTVRDVRGATIQFGDIAEVEKGKEDVIQYVQKGDSLIITGSDSDDQPDGRRLLNFTLPYNATLSAENSLIYFEKGKKNAQPDLVIHLQRSHAIFFEPAMPFLLGHVKVVASDSSIAAFQGITQVNNLEVQLSNSALEYNEGNAGQLSIVTDSISRLSLQSKNLLKAKITTISN
ncbi:MAG: hypothetical protein WDN26_24535 [Chitinophagaceae bacterium]